MDAGIATNENLAMLKKEDYDYVCVSRSKPKGYLRISPKVLSIEDITWEREKGKRKTQRGIFSSLFKEEAYRK